MPMNESKGNMYEFITHTWNTIKGKCPHDCSYCYMKRWGALKDVRFDRKELKTDLGTGNYIFVGSSCDMWAKGMNSDWISETITHCKKFDNSYLFQSKNPELLYLCESFLPKKTTICTTIETNRMYPFFMGNTPDPYERAMAMEQITLPKYVTIEPIIDFDLEPLIGLIRRCNPVQVNIGADSGNNGLPEPSMDKVLELIEALGKFTIIANKHNLGRIINK